VAGWEGGREGGWVGGRVGGRVGAWTRGRERKREGWWGSAKNLKKSVVFGGLGGTALGNPGEGMIATGQISTQNMNNLVALEGPGGSLESA